MDFENGALRIWVAATVLWNMFIIGISLMNWGEIIKNTGSFKEGVIHLMTNVFQAGILAPLFILATMWILSKVFMWVADGFRG